MEQFENRPWGSFEVLSEGPNYKVKRFFVKSGKRMSYQYHNKRSEYWVVVQGSGNFTLDAINRQISVGDVLYIDRKSTRLNSSH